MTLKTRPGPLLTKDQMERYSRQTILEEVGLQGQRKLLDSKVLIVGAGGLGSPAAIYLAAAGNRTLGIVGGGRVGLSKLHRPGMDFNHHISRPKTQYAPRTPGDIKPCITRVSQHDEAT